MPPVVFDAAFDPDQPFIHRKTWATDIKLSYKKVKQLIGLRPTPNEYVEFNVSGILPADMQHLDWLLNQGVPDGFRVPMWRDRYPLLAPLAASSTVVPVDTVGRMFAVGDNVLFWVDPVTWEYAEIEAVAAASITLVTGTVSAWGKNTLVIPLRQGFLPKDVDSSRLARNAVGSTVGFVLQSDDSTFAVRRLLVDEARWVIVEVISVVATGNPETLDMTGAISGEIASGLWSTLPGTITVFGPTKRSGYLYFFATHQISGNAGPGTVSVISGSEWEVGLEDGSGNGGDDDIILNVTVQNFPPP